MLDYSMMQSAGTMVRIYRFWVVGCLVVVVLCVAARGESAASRAPNFGIILCDNLGYGDIGCFGSKLHRTPHVDRMAREGTRFTSFYVTSGVCTPSRSSLMTGCYPRRVNMHVDENGTAVLRPVAKKGLHSMPIRSQASMQSMMLSKNSSGKPII